MSIDKKMKMIAALSAFQVAGSIAAASEIKMVMIAESDKVTVTCDVADLDRAKTINDWPGSIMNVRLSGTNAQILQKVNDDFAGGNYFDAYPHKLPELFKAGACKTVQK